MCVDWKTHPLGNIGIDAEVLTQDEYRNLVQSFGEAEINVSFHIDASGTATWSHPICTDCETRLKNQLTAFENASIDVGILAEGQDPPLDEDPNKNKAETTTNANFRSGCIDSCGKYGSLWDAEIQNHGIYGSPCRVSRIVL